MHAPSIQFVAGACGPIQGFHLFDCRRSAQLRDVPPDVRSLSLADLRMDSGSYALELRYADNFGKLSDSGASTLEIDFETDSGTGKSTFSLPSLLKAEAAAGGFVDVSFVLPAGGGVMPSSFLLRHKETTELVDPQIVVGRRRFILERVGPFTHGLTVRLQLQASDGLPGGVRGPLIDLPSVIIDGQAPRPVPPMPGRDCCCES